MSALASTCGAAASLQVVHLSPVQGVVILMATLVVGILLAEGVHRWVQEGDEQIARALAEAQDESLAVATEVIAPYVAPEPRSIPLQRVSADEDFLEDFGSDR